MRITAGHFGIVGAGPRATTVRRQSHKVLMRVTLGPLGGASETWARRGLQTRASPLLALLGACSTALGLLFVKAGRWQQRTGSHSRERRRKTAEGAAKRSAFCLSPERGGRGAAVPPARLHKGQQGLRLVPLSPTPPPPPPSPAQWSALPSSVLTLAAAAGRLPRRLTSGTVFPSSCPHAHAQAQRCSVAPEGPSSPRPEGAGAGCAPGGLTFPSLVVFPTTATLVCGAGPPSCACPTRMSRLSGWLS